MSEVLVEPKATSGHCFHGGDIQTVSEIYGIAKEDWLDLSTGINPKPFPFSAVNPNAYTQLPYLDKAFLASAKAYYHHEGVPVAGSQEAIDWLPLYLEKLPVLVPAVGYKEYQQQFVGQGFTIKCYPSMIKDEALAYLHQSLTENANQHMVVINPNNPTGLQLTIDELHTLASLLSEKAFLIVDEAFIDLDSENSLLSGPLPKNCIVFRSFGKFFGLAGLRLGFVFANDAVQEALSNYLSPWRVNGCAQFIATEAFEQTAWQGEARRWIKKQAQWQRALILKALNPKGVKCMNEQSLFNSYLVERNCADAIFDHFAQWGVLIRVVPVDDKVAILRFGLFDSSNERHYSLFVQCLESLFRAPS